MENTRNRFQAAFETVPADTKIGLAIRNMLNFYDFNSYTRQKNQRDGLELNTEGCNCGHNCACARGSHEKLLHEAWLKVETALINGLDRLVGAYNFLQANHCNKVITENTKSISSYAIRDSGWYLSCAISNYLHVLTKMYVDDQIQGYEASRKFIRNFSNFYRTEDFYRIVKVLAD